jgi:hypothetical protein
MKRVWMALLAGALLLGPLAATASATGWSTTFSSVGADALSGGGGMGGDGSDNIYFALNATGDVVLGSLTVEASEEHGAGIVASIDSTGDARWAHGFEQGWVGKLIVHADGTTYAFVGSEDPEQPVTIGEVELPHGGIVSFDEAGDLRWVQPISSYMDHFAVADDGTVFTCGMPDASGDYTIGGVTASVAAPSSESTVVARLDGDDGTADWIVAVAPWGGCMISADDDQVLVFAGSDFTLAGTTVPQDVQSLVALDASDGDVNWLSYMSVDDASWDLVDQAPDGSGGTYLVVLAHDYWGEGDHSLLAEGNPVFSFDDQPLFVLVHLDGGGTWDWTRAITVGSVSTGWTRLLDNPGRDPQLLVSSAEPASFDASGGTLVLDADEPAAYLVDISSGGAASVAATLPLANPFDVVWLTETWWAASYYDDASFGAHVVELVGTGDTAFGSV